MKSWVKVLRQNTHRRNEVHVILHMKEEAEKERIYCLLLLPTEIYMQCHQLLTRVAGADKKKSADANNDRTYYMLDLVRDGDFLRAKNTF